MGQGGFSQHLQAWETPGDTSPLEEAGVEHDMPKCSPNTSGVQHGGSRRNTIQQTILNVFCSASPKHQSQQTILKVTHFASQRQNEAGASKGLGLKTHINVTTTRRCNPHIWHPSRHLDIWPMSGSPKPGSSCCAIPHDLSRRAQSESSWHGCHAL